MHMMKPRHFYQERRRSHCLSKGKDSRKNMDEENSWNRGLFYLLVHQFEMIVPVRSGAETTEKEGKKLNAANCLLSPLCLFYFNFIFLSRFIVNIKNFMYNSTRKMKFHFRNPAFFSYSFPLRVLVLQVLKLCVCVFFTSFFVLDG